MRFSGRQKSLSFLQPVLYFQSFLRVQVVPVGTGIRDSRIFISLTKQRGPIERSQGKMYGDFPSDIFFSYISWIPHHDIFFFHTPPITTYNFGYLRYKICLYNICLIYSMCFVDIIRVHWIFPMWIYKPQTLTFDSICNVLDDNWFCVKQYFVFPSRNHIIFNILQNTVHSRYVS